MLENKIGSGSAWQIIESAKRDVNGEIDFLISEEVFGQLNWTPGMDSDVLQSSVKALNRAEIIDAAVALFRKSYTKILDETLNELIE